MELCLLQLTKIVVLFIDRGRAIRSLGFELGLIQIRLSTGLPPSRLLKSINPQLYPCCYACNKFTCAHLHLHTFGITASIYQDSYQIGWRYRSKLVAFVGQFPVRHSNWEFSWRQTDGRPKAAWATSRGLQQAGCINWWWLARESILIWWICHRMDMPCFWVWEAVSKLLK